MAQNSRRESLHRDRRFTDKHRLEVQPPSIPAARACKNNTAGPRGLTDSQATMWALLAAETDTRDTVVWSATIEVWLVMYARGSAFARANSEV